MGGGRRPRPRNLAPERVVDFYEEAIRGRSASHHLQVKAALALLYHVLGSPNPFARCHGPKFAPEKTELRYHTSSQLGQLLRELREDKGSYFGHLCYHLASALFFTGCRYHERALLTMDRLVREPGGVIIATRLQIKGGSFRDLPLTRELADSLEEWFAFLERVKGVRLRTGGNRLRGIAARLSWPGRRALWAASSNGTKTCAKRPAALRQLPRVIGPSDADYDAARALS